MPLKDGLFLWTSKVTRTKSTNRNHRQHWHNHQIPAIIKSSLILVTYIILPWTYIQKLPCPCSSHFFHSALKTHKKKTPTPQGPPFPSKEKCVFLIPNSHPKKRSTNNLDRASAGPPKSPETPEAKRIGEKTLPRKTRWFFPTKNGRSIGGPGLNWSALKVITKKASQERF